MQDPEDSWMHLDDYIHIHEYPGTNGKGHSKSRINNRDVVVIPGNKVGKLRRTHKNQADLETTIGNTDNVDFAAPDCLEEMQKALTLDVFVAPATGVTLDALLGGARGSGCSSLAGVEHVLAIAPLV